MNGNPFYVPPVVPDMSGQIMELGRMGMQKDNLAQQRALEERRLTGAESHNKFMENNATEQLNIQKRESEAKYPQVQPFNNGEYDKLISKFRINKIPTEKISFLNTDLLELAKNPNIKRGDVANIIEQKWPEIYSQTSDELRNEIISLSDKAAKLSPTDPKYKEIAGQIENLGKLQSGIDNVKDPKQIFFPDIAEHEANSKAAIAALKTPKIDHVDLGDKTEIYRDGVLIKTAKKGENPGTHKSEANQIRRDEIANKRIALTGLQQELRDLGQEKRTLMSGTMSMTDPEGFKIAMDELNTRYNEIQAGIKELSGVKGKSAAKQTPTEQMPDAKANSGRTIKDTETGIEYKSNGKTWVKK